MTGGFGAKLGSRASITLPPALRTIVAPRVFISLELFQQNSLLLTQSGISAQDLARTEARIAARNGDSALPWRGPGALNVSANCIEGTNFCVFADCRIR
jgi:hypothetical protein